MKGERRESVTMPNHPPESVPAETQEVVDQLVENHREFLRYVERRVGNRAVAKEIVQEALVRGLDRGDRSESRWSGRSIESFGTPWSTTSAARPWRAVAWTNGLPS
jgi:hypothetical protein